MKLLKDTIAFRRDRMKATASLGGRSLPVDLGVVEEEIQKLVLQMNELLGKIRDAVNANETGFNVIYATSGTASTHLPILSGGAFPAAPKEYHGRLYIFSISGAADQLWF